MKCGKMPSPGQGRSGPHHEILMRGQKALMRRKKVSDKHWKRIRDQNVEERSVGAIIGIQVVLE